MKDFIAYVALFFMVLGTGFMFLDWYAAGVTTLMIVIVICIIAGLPYFAHREAEHNENVR